ncbi:MAG: hypothetical protein H6Q15_2359 [Bacteroidetes bacterium]|nr:hypothetical protein [Bacteroidota bacterium]
MKKFKIIEEGRLSKKDMSSINGGSDQPICKPTYSITPNCLAELATCPIYWSCNNTSYISCRNFKGSPGPLGEI